MTPEEKRQLIIKATLYVLKEYEETFRELANLDKR